MVSRTTRAARDRGALETQHWALGGDWTMARGTRSSTGGGHPVLPRATCIILTPGARTYRCEISVDRRRATRGRAQLDIDDLGNGAAPMRMYQLIRQADPAADRRFGSVPRRRRRGVHYLRMSRAACGRHRGDQTMKALLRDGLRLGRGDAARVPTTSSSTQRGGRW